MSQPRTRTLLETRTESDVGPTVESGNGVGNGNGKERHGEIERKKRAGQRNVNGSWSGENVERTKQKFRRGGGVARRASHHHHQQMAVKELLVDACSYCTKDR